jgi:hypothetical protein
MESLDAAREILDAHENVQSTNQMGLKSIVKQVNQYNSLYVSDITFLNFFLQRKASDACKVYLSFSEAVTEEAVKKLDDNIKEVALFIEKNRQFKAFSQDFLVS